MRKHKSTSVNNPFSISRFLLSFRICQELEAPPDTQGIRMKNALLTAAIGSNLLVASPAEPSSLPEKPGWGPRCVFR